MIKPVIISFFSLLMVIQLSAQLSHQNIYLKNGGMLKGKVDEDTTGTIKVKTLRGDILLFDGPEISKIEKRTYRYVNYTSAGFIMGSAINEKPTVLSVLSENNIVVNEYFAAGAVFGVELLNETTIPLGINVKSFIPFNTRVLFFNASLGNSFSVDKPRFLDYYIEPLHAYGGVFTTLELGFNIPLNYRNGLFFAMGYRYSELNYDYERWGYGIVDRKNTYHRLSARFGISLN